MIAALCLTVLAAQEPLAEAKRLYDEGVSFYRTGDYEKALEAFSRAYALSQAPELLFNIAQAYQLKGPSGCEAAGRFYRRYLAALPNAENREQVLQRLQKLGPCAEEKPIEIAEPPDAKQEPAPTPPPQVVVERVEVPAALRPWRGWGPLGLVLGAVAAGGTGAGLLVWTSRDFDVALAQSCHPHCAQTASTLQQRADVGYALAGIGAALAVAGLVWGLLVAVRGE